MANWRSHSSFGCPARAERSRSGSVLPSIALACLTLLAMSACGRADEPAATRPDIADPACMAAPEGALKARLQGAIDDEIDWSGVGSHCIGGVRPDGSGLRLVFKGSTAAGEPLLIVIGAGPVAPGESKQNVPVNLTAVIEGSGRFFATQGDDKCAMDRLEQEAVEGEPGLYRVMGRGYCTQPARAVDGSDSLLLSRFDLVAIVREDEPASSGTENVKSP
jgi:hypothetical protein